MHLCWPANALLVYARVMKLPTRSQSLGFAFGKGCSHWDGVAERSAVPSESDPN